MIINGTYICSIDRNLIYLLSKNWIELLADVVFFVIDCILAQPDDYIWIGLSIDIGRVKVICFDDVDTDEDVEWIIAGDALEHAVPGPYLREKSYLPEGLVSPQSWLSWPKDTRPESTRAKIYCDSNQTNVSIPIIFINHVTDIVTRVCFNSHINKCNKNNQCNTVIVPLILSSLRFIIYTVIHMQLSLSHIDAFLKPVPIHRF